jgi:MFS family permease
MTQARARPADPDDGSAGPSGTGPADGRPASPYRTILRLPGALAFSATGFVARMTMSMFGLGTVLLIAATTGRYGVAGLVAAAASVCYAIGAPQFARLSDSFGQRRVLRPQAMVFAAATVAFMALAELRAPLAAVIVVGALAGAAMPSVGSMVRARWSVLLADTDLLHTAFSLESVLDEIIFVVGPALVTVLAINIYPAAGVGTAMVLCVTGTLLFAALRGTQPPPRPRTPPGAQTAQAGQAAPGGAVAPRPRRARTWAAVPGLVTMVPVYWLLGAMFATIDLSTVAFAAEHGHVWAAGLVLGVYALGSAVGGVWYGSRHWRAPLERRFVITLGCAVTGVTLFWFQPGLATLFGVIFVAGVAIAPTLIAGYGLIERQSPEERRTESMSWLSSAVSVGVATGSPVAGHLIDAHGARWGYLFAAACGLAAAIVAAAGLGRLRPAGGRGQRLR